MRTRSSAHARLAIIVGLLLTSGVSAVLAGHPMTAHGASATSTSSTTQSYFVQTNSPSYTGTATILVTGVAPSFASGIGVQILQPKGVVVADNSVGPAQNSSFTTTFQAGGLGWNVTGKYIVLVTAAIPDSIAAPTTFNTTFDYTAVVTTTTTTPTVTGTTQPNGGNGLSLASILPIIVAIVVVVALMGFLLRSRGRRKPATRAAPAAAPAPK